MSCQLRAKIEAAGHPLDSRFQMSKETEQKTNREFFNHRFRIRCELRSESVLKNACWDK
jgi:hypothetical protein